MANRERGEVSLEVGGKEYTLRLSANAQCDLEELLSTDDKPVNFQVFMARLIRYERNTDVRAFLWATLREFHPQMSLKDAGTLLHDVGGVYGLGDKLQQIVKSSQPDPEDIKTLGLEGKVPPPKARAKSKAGIGTH